MVTALEWLLGQDVSAVRWNGVLLASLLQPRLVLEQNRVLSTPGSQVDLR